MLYLVLRTLAGALEGFSLYKSDKKCRKINVMSRHGETCLLVQDSAVLFRSTSCWPLSQAQRRTFIFGTGKQREMFSLQDDCNSLCLFVYSNAYVYNAPPTWLVIFTVLWFSIGLQWLQLHPWSQAHSTEQHRTSRPEPLLHSAQKRTAIIYLLLWIIASNCALMHTVQVRAIQWMKHIQALNISEY